MPSTALGKVSCLLVWGRGYIESGGDHGKNLAADFMCSNSFGLFWNLEVGRTSRVVWSTNCVVLELNLDLELESV